MADVSKYNPKVHPALVKKLFAEGKDIAAFCAKVGVSRDTWYTWINVHPEFKEAVEIARELARDWWETAGQEALFNSDFNQNVWCRIMLNRFEMALHRKVRIPGLAAAKTHKERFDLVIREVDQGKISPEEANKLGAFVSIGAKVDEAEEFEQRLKAIEDKQNCH